MRDYTLLQLSQMLKLAIDEYSALQIEDDGAPQHAISSLPEFEQIRSLTGEDRSELAVYAIEQIGVLRREALRLPRESAERRRHSRAVDVCRVVAAELLHPPPPLTNDQVEVLAFSAACAGRMKDESLYPLTRLVAALQPHALAYGFRPEHARAIERLRARLDGDALPAIAGALDALLEVGLRRRAAIVSDAKQRERCEFDSIPDRDDAGRALDLLDRFCSSADSIQGRTSAGHHAAGVEIKTATGPTQIAFVRLGLARIEGLAMESRQEPNPGTLRLINFHHLAKWADPLSECIAGILRRKLPWRDQDLIEVVRSCADFGAVSERVMPHVASICSTLARHYRDANLPEALARQIGRLAAATGLVGGAAERSIQRRLLILTDGERPYPMSAGEAWSDRARADLESLHEEARRGWESLLEHCAEAKGSKPPTKWTDAAGRRLAAIGTRPFAQSSEVWFDLVDRPRTVPLPERPWTPDQTHLIQEINADILKGLCWIAGTIESPDLARALGRLAISCYRKVPGIGPRAVKVGNAAVYALGQMPGRDSLGQLAMLRVKVKFGTAQKLIEKALGAAAAREGLPLEEIEELAVPSYGLTEVGLRREPLGDYSAELRVEGFARPVLGFLKPDGKPQKSVPAAIRETHAADLKELKAAAKDIGAMLPAQRDRVDGLFLEDKSWELPTWRERYLDHPLVGVIARRLLWRFARGRDGAWDAGAPSRSAMWLDGVGLVGLDAEPVELDDPATRVRLWHPIEVEQAEILAWREFLERHQLVQPFKQAHREVYLLTDAERNTGVYSNRYAAHVLRQHQFNALCAARRWKNKLRLLVDDEFPPASRPLPAWNLRAEFWIEGAGEDYGNDTNEAGVFNYLITDQVRFYGIGAAPNSGHAGGGGFAMRAGANPINELLPLERIPPLVLSEVMRDVDLFVGVTSVGNNPAWQDGGPEGRYRDYWWSYSFGDLSGTAETRRHLLERLVPRLKIADRCTIDGRFLAVRGDLRTYKIHLGSGNILMEPNDQYLCIVASSRADPTLPPKLYLPFEGDRTLAIILSKAFLLADDTKITDRSITSQIGRG